MALTEEESKKIKEHLLKQLSNFPEDRQTQIKAQIESMTPEQVEVFIEQNNLSHLKNGCIMCSITKDESPSYKISENSKNIAILELTPLSKGHALIIPKSHEDRISKTTKNLATSVSKILSEKFNPKEIQINEIKIMEHPILEVIPIYGGEIERTPATQTELAEIQKEMLEPPKDIKVIKEKQAKENLPKFKPRIP